MRLKKNSGYNVWGKKPTERKKKNLCFRKIQNYFING